MDLILALIIIVCNWEIDIIEKFRINKVLKKFWREKYTYATVIYCSSHIKISLLYFIG